MGRTQCIVFAIVLNVLGAPLWGQATYTAASCNLSDVQAAINLELARAADGDIIRIPSGTCTWTGSTGVSANFTKSVTIQGQGAISATDDGAGTTGTDATVIIDNLTRGSSSTIDFSTPAGKSIRVTGIAFLMNGSSTVAANGILALGGKSTSQRVDHCHFFLNISGAVGLHIAGAANGVVDHNYFDASSGTLTNDFAIHNGREWNGETEGWGDQSWVDTDHFGSSQFMFFEDNRFHNGDPGDGASAARYVMRHNTITPDAITGLQGQMFNHGLTPGRYRGMRAAEVYSNRFVQPGTTGSGGPAYSVNSGTLLFWGNTVTQYRHAVDINITRSDNSAYNFSATPSGWGYCGTGFNGAGSGWDQNSSAATGYACIDAPGRGAGDLLTGNFPNVKNSRTGTISWPQQARVPLYIWGNNYTPSGGYSGTSLVSFSSAVSENRDWYQTAGSFNATVGVGSGLSSARPGTCTAGPGGNTSGVAYWATDQNTLYVCSATNVWTPYYTPYTYPHPLTSGSGSSSSLMPPTNLVSTVQ